MYTFVSPHSLYKSRHSERGKGMPEGHRSGHPGWLIDALHLLFCAMAVFFVWLSASTFAEKAYGLHTLAYVTGALACVLLLLFLSARLGGSPRRFAVFLFLAAFVLKAAFALAVHTQPESDFALLYEAAQKLAAGDNTMPETAYFQIWPYQSAFVVWMAFFIKAFGAGVSFFKLTNCVLSAAATVLIYLLAKRFSSERGARAAAAAFLLYPGTFLLVPVLTNQHLSEFLFLLFVYVFTGPAETRKQDVFLGAAGGCLLALGNAVRPVGIVFVLALCALALLGFLSRMSRNRARRGRPALRAAAALAIYFAAGAALSGLFQAADLNEYGLGNNLPEWKFVVGLNEKYDGCYNPEDEQAVFGAGVDRKQAAKSLMDERLSILKSPKRFSDLAYRKARMMWGSFEPTYWAFTPEAVEALEGRIAPERLEELLYKGECFTSLLYMWIYLLIALGALDVLLRRRADTLVSLLMLVALAYFCAHLFIEVQERYRSFMIAFTFPLIAPGVEALMRPVRCAGLRSRRR